VGSNLHINDTHSNVLQISGNINAASVVLGGISIAPTFDLEVVTNTGNTTPYTVEFNNAATAFVTTANATIGDTLTASKLVGDGSGISAIQSSNVTDFASNVSRITTLETDLGNNSARITNLSSNLSDNSARITNLSSNLSDNSARITNLSSNLSDNSSRITALESGDISISGDKTFTGDIIFESNVHMNSGNVFVANTVNLTVSDPIIELGSNNSGTNDLGIIMTRPNNNSNVAVVFDESVDILRMGYTLNGANDTVVDLDSNALAVSVQGALSAGSNLEVGTANLFVDTTTSNVGVGISSPAYKLDVDGDINLSTGSTLKINGTDAVFSNWTASGSDIYRSSGNVGIGTANPMNKLDVRSDNYATFGKATYNAAGWSGIRLGTPYTTNHDAYCSVIESYNNHASDYNSDLRFKTSNGNNAAATERMRITAAGNVGIGTNNPLSTLEVGDGTSSTSGDAPGSISVSGTGATKSNGGKPGLYHRANVGLGLWSDAHMSFEVNGYQGNQTEAMRILTNGNVGIGTASPNGNLHIMSDLANASSQINPSAQLVLHSSLAGLDDDGDIGASLVFTQRWLDSSPNSHGTMGSIHGFKDLSAGNYGGGLLFKTQPGSDTAPVERMRIDRDGNVGIGTGIPRSALDINNTGAMIIPTGTTAQQPGTGYTGMLRFNTSLGKIQVYNGTEWLTVGGMSATGGTVTNVDGYKIHTFTTSGTFTVISGGEMEYLIIGGGGGAPGRDVGGGGGAGGMLTGTYALPAGSYTITVGPGGLGKYDSVANVSGMKGSDSSIGSLFTATGGGAGKPHHKALPTGDDNGGSGGGGAGLYDLTGGTGISGQGNNGGNGAGTSVTEYGGGGGGGAGQAGSSAASGRHGGDGIQSSISGTATYYAGGGGGAGHRASGNRTEGDGGLGGGGPCNQSTTTSTRNGTDGLGGGGGASRNTGLTGGSGGDGIVIIRYLS
jgi:TolA-binding protein